MTALLICSMAACSTSTDNTVTDPVTTLSVTENKAITADDLFNETEEDTKVQSKASDGGTQRKDASSTASEAENSTEKPAAEQSSEQTGTNDVTSNGFRTRTKPQDNQSFTPAAETPSSNDNSPAPQAPDSAAAPDNGSSGSYAEFTPTEQEQAPTNTGNSGSTSGSSTSVSAQTMLDTSDIFSSRDLTQTADLTDSVAITAESNKTVTITEAGVYVISGSASNFTVRVEADKESKVQLVLDGTEISNENFPVIYVVSADKVFVTTTNTVNTLSVTGSFTSDGDTNTDAVIFSKDDLVFNGTGTLVINSSAGNGISGKDDIKFTGGTYEITSAKDSIEANDSIAVYDGSFEINSSKDGFHSENDDDDTVGWIYIQGGTFNIRASSDSIQANTFAQIDGGTFNLVSSEGIEATYVLINGGDISITASDDGINAARKSNSFGTPTIVFNGGSTTIVMGQGDTDAVDANGNIIVNGGTINVTAQMSSFDYDGTAQYNGGTIIINGTQVDSIPQSMMGGGMGGGMRGGMRGGW